MFVIGLVTCRDKISFSDELIYPYIFAILISLIYFRERKCINKITENVVLYLGKISYNIFLLHYGVCYLFVIYIPGRDYLHSITLYCVIVIMSGIVLELMMNFISKLKCIKGIGREC